MRRQSWEKEALEVADGNPAASDWISFYQVCLNRLESFNTLQEIETENFETINVFVDFEIQSAFNKYMDAVVFASQHPQ